MKPRDEEFWVTKVFDLLKSNLNTKITAINAEKADTITLNTVNADAYYYMTFGNELPNYIPCVVFAVDVDEASTNGAEISENVKIMIQLVVSDEMNSDPINIYKMLSRYRRALKDVFSSNCRDFHKLEIVKLPDTPFMVGSMTYHTVGIGVSFFYAA
jgi:hypothetical protein